MTAAPAIDRESYLKPRAAFVRYCVFALWFLAKARLAHLSLKSKEIETRNLRSQVLGRVGPPPAETQALACRIGWFIGRMAQRVPWRSDCLVQALAAQEWLNCRRIANVIVIGVRIERGDCFAAHAWNRVDDLVITGGDPAAYSVLLDLPVEAALTDQLAEDEGEPRNTLV